MTLHCQLDWHRVFSNGSANNTWQSQLIIRLAAKFDLSKLISRILTSTHTELEMPQSLPNVISLKACRFQQPKTFSDIRNLRRKKFASDLTFFKQINSKYPLTEKR